MSLVKTKIVLNIENKAISMGMYYQGEHGSADRDLELGLVSPYMYSFDDEDLSFQTSVLDLEQFKASQYNWASVFSGYEVFDDSKGIKKFNDKAITTLPLVVDSATPSVKGNVVVQQDLPTNKVRKTNSRSDFIQKIDAAFEDFVGMPALKEEVAKQAAYVLMQKMRIKAGLQVVDLPSRHLVFTGNPGTGKTTVARIIAEIYADLGIIKKNKIIETDRSGLVAEYLGQTAIKTANVIKSALGGILFIDEAYSLTEQEHNEYGKEAIDTLVKMMEDHREDLIVIVAGYGEEMRHFIESNPGLNSRFSKQLHFENYTPEELWEILIKMVNKNSYTITNQEETKMLMMHEFEKQISLQGKGFGNARFIRNFFEAASQRQALRVMTQDAGINKIFMMELKSEDFLIFNVSK